MSSTTHHKTATKEIQFTKHVIRKLYPFPRRQGTKLLFNRHGFHKIHIRLLRKIQHTLLQTISRVSQNIQGTCKTEVLRIVGNKTQLETLVLFHIGRIHDIITVETDTIVRNRAIKRILQ